MLAGLIGLAMLAVGEAAPAAWPVHVRIEARGTLLQVAVDGQEHTVHSELVGGWRGIQLESPGPNQREYQVDGSDTTASDDRSLAALGFRLYGLDAWLRDEDSYSRWEHLRVVDLDTGLRAVGDALPADFVVDADLRRPEAPARLWLLGPEANLREGLELDRDRRNARWVVERFGSQAAQPRWFFPEQPLPFVADLLHLLGRATAAGYALALVPWLLARLSSLFASAGGPGQSAAAPWTSKARRDAWAASASRWRSIAARLFLGAQSPRGSFGRSIAARLLWALNRRSALFAAAAPWSPNAPTVSAPLAGWWLAAWLLASLLVSWRVYHQLPHILDAVSYDFQAAVLRSGSLAEPVPALVDLVKGPFEVTLDGRWFSQYPPGAAAAYAVGGWLAGPVAGLLLLASTAWTAGRLYGPSARAIATLLGVLSPFVLFQSGSYLSHPIAAGLLGLALAAFVLAETSSTRVGYVACGGLLGAAFLTREVASILFALPLAIRLFALNRWRPLGLMLLAGLPFLAMYLAYNAAQTGNPVLLPRAVFDPTDHFGFGDNVGFHHRHTLAAGLVNTDELLTLLQFDLFGWPPLFALGLLLVPFLAGRPHTWDVVAAEGVLTFVVAYVGYFYHGIALGPRYYFEALPWLLLLGARGVDTLVGLGGRLGAGLVIVPLCAYTLLFYLPSELARRGDYSGLPEGRRAVLSFVEPTPLGPRITGVPDQSLVLTDEWWLFHAALAPLNCADLPRCGVIFALASNDEDRQLLVRAYPGRQVLHVVDNASVLTVQR